MADWRVFSETEIARMIEVEETSDMMLTMLRSIQPRRKGPLDRVYRDYDAEFPQGLRVATRFRTVMDRISDSLGSTLQSLAFRRRTLFNTLFIFYYDHLYGLGSDLKRAKPKPLPAGLKEAVQIASEKITAGNVPRRLAKVLRGATSDLASRQARCRFLARDFHEWIRSVLTLWGADIEISLA
jgi:hypothetical protein